MAQSVTRLETRLLVTIAMESISLVGSFKVHWRANFLLRRKREYYTAKQAAVTLAIFVGQKRQRNVRYLLGGIVSLDDFLWRCQFAVHVPTGT